MRLSLVICLAAVLSLSVSGCRGEEKPSRPLSTPHLHAIVLIISEGLPWPVSLVGDQAQPNQVAAEEFPDPEQWLESYEEWGRVSGYSARFEAEAEGVYSVETEAEYYSSTDGAESAWEAVREFLLSEEMLRHLEEELNMSGVEIAEVEAGKVGDESTAFRMETKSEGTTVETFVILFRRDGVVASATVGAEEGVSSVDDAATVAEQLDDRIQAILETER